MVCGCLYARACGPAKVEAGDDARDLCNDSCVPAKCVAYYLGCNPNSKVAELVSFTTETERKQTEAENAEEQLEYVKKETEHILCFVSQQLDCIHFIKL